MVSVAPLLVSALLATSVVQTNRLAVDNQAKSEARQVKLTEAAELRAEKREEWRLKLQTLKDERKQKIVENIDERIAALNTKWVEHWNRTLDRLSSVLDKLEDLAETDADNAAIADAQAAIGAAQAAVDSQATKTYEIQIADNTPIGQSVRSTISNFHNDLKVAKESIKAAKDATVNALRTVKGENAEVKENEE